MFKSFRKNDFLQCCKSRDTSLFLTQLTPHMSSNITIIQSDLTNIECTKGSFIVHQCNATGNRNLGLASVLSKKYPRCNLYSGKHKVDQRNPGTFILRDHIIALIAQLYPGKPSSNDSASMRLNWFCNALDDACRIKGVETLYLPYGIGCGLAGGDWKEYAKAIELISCKNQHVKIILVKLN